jgi:mono/diheme cytochrome c family protein
LALQQDEKSKAFEKELKMPDYNFSDIEEVEAITTYLLSLKSEKVPSSYVLPLGDPPSEYNPQGEFGQILEKYRCLACHKILGKGGELAPELSQEGSRVQKEWLQKFLKAPYALRPILAERMLKYKVLDSEIETMHSYFRTTLVDDRVEKLSEVVKGMSLHDPRLIQMGEKLYYEKYSCNACHQINLKGGTIGPDLTDVRKQLRTEWIVYYLRDPKAFLKRSVEPVFKLTDKEIEALTAFLITLKEKE